MWEVKLTERAEEELRINIQSRKINWIEKKIIVEVVRIKPDHNYRSH